MVYMISDCYNDKRNRREITLAYDSDNKDDNALMDKIHRLCMEQPRCQNCINFYYEGCLGGYKACWCKIHGNLEYVGNSNYNMDGSKCKDYIRKED